jgi:hypothetical protein
VKTVNEHIREHILNRHTLAGLRESEWSIEFEHLMRNRLLVGSFRYGKMRSKRNEASLTKFHLNYIRDKLERYRFTGNTEMLVDVANLCLVEFEIGDHPKKHFKAEDRKA